MKVPLARRISGSCHGCSPGQGVVAGRPGRVELCAIAKLGSISTVLRLEAVSPDSGHIVITSTGDRASLRLAVWDNGRGIPPGIQDSVFQTFVSYGKAEGSGLGPAIAKKIVQDHGGDLPRWRK
jgi:light-regulated signal transduction histidine kinase (bacteriophytochrome)